MNQKALLENIKNSSKSELGNLTDEDLEKLLQATVKTIDSILEKENILEIDDFGTFSRRKQGSVSSFKPIDRLIERINKKR